MLITYICDLLLKIAKVDNWDQNKQKRHNDNNINKTKSSHPLLAKLKESELFFNN